MNGIAQSRFGRRQFLRNAGLAVAGVGLGAAGLRAFEDRASSVVPGVRQTDAPNVLLIVLDTVRAKNLGVYGYDRPTTPNLQRLASRGTVFDWPVATAPWTLWSHLSMLTGLYPHQTTADWLLPLEETHPTLAEVLGSQGYASAGIVANTEYVSYETGLDRGFGHYEDYVFSAGEMLQSSTLARTLINHPRVRDLVGTHELVGRKRAPDVNRQFLRWMNRRENGRPFFALLNYYDAHAPYYPPAPFDRKFGGGVVRENPMLDVGWEWSDEQIQAEVDAYDGAIAYIDHHLGLLFDELEESGEFDNTLIIVTSDHGEEFGEHGLMGHANSLYLPNLHVPLLLSYPGKVPAGQRVTEPVSLKDIPSTVLDLSGTDPKTSLPGSSLARCWSDQNARQAPLLSEVNASPWDLPDWYPIAKGDMQSLIDERYHYIKTGDGTEELYAYRTDPDERIDLVAGGQGRDELARFRRVLEQFA